MIVVGSPNSSNSNRLREVARTLGVPAYMVDNAAELRPGWLAGKHARRRHRRRLGAGSAGAGGHRPAEGARRGERAPARGRRGERRVPAAQGPAAAAPAPGSGRAPDGAESRPRRGRPAVAFLTAAHGPASGNSSRRGPRRRRSAVLSPARSSRSTCAATFRMP